MAGPYHGRNGDRKLTSHRGLPRPLAGICPGASRHSRGWRLYPLRHAGLLLKYPPRRDIRVGLFSSSLIGPRAFCEVELAAARLPGLGLEKRSALGRRGPLCELPDFRAFRRSRPQKFCSSRFGKRIVHRALQRAICKNSVCNIPSKTNGSFQPAAAISSRHPSRQSRGCSQHETWHQGAVRPNRQNKAE